jgi:hypothetical protein
MDLSRAAREKKTMTQLNKSGHLAWCGLIALALARQFSGLPALLFVILAITVFFAGERRLIQIGFQLHLHITLGFALIFIVHPRLPGNRMAVDRYIPQRFQTTIKQA